MAHKLDTIATGSLEGKTAFLSANTDKVIRDSPWHGLGQRLDRPATVEEALRLSGQDFEVLRRPVMFNFGTDENPLMRQVPDQFVNYRSDTKEPLGVVGKRYTITQNTSALSFFDPIVGAGEGIIETAGALNGGRQVFMSARMPGHIHVPGDDIECFVLLFNSHDGSNSILAVITPVRVVCNNTLMLAMKNCTNRVRIMHTKSAEMRLKEAGRLMGIYDMFKKDMSEALTHMTKAKLSEAQVDNYIKALFSSESEEKGKETSTRATNIRNEVKEYLYGTSGGQQMFPGTVYQAYQGITGYFQNVKSFRTEESRIVQGILGDDARTMEAAFRMALDFAK